jgi:hypothetical protein
MALVITTDDQDFRDPSIRTSVPTSMPVGGDRVGIAWRIFCYGRACGSFYVWWVERG